jgi:predicted XRE-type DNA-binding protein
MAGDWRNLPRMPDDPILTLKRQLADAILALASQTNMHVAARAFGIGVPRMSDLRHGRIARFSVERLIRILAMAGRKVELSIVVSSPERRPWFGAPHPRRLTPSERIGAHGCPTGAAVAPVEPSPGFALDPKKSPCHPRRSPAQRRTHERTTPRQESSA